MVERYAIYCLGKGYFAGIDYTGKAIPVFYSENEDYGYELFNTEGEAWSRLQTVLLDCKIGSVTGKYRIDKLIFIS